MTVTTPSRPAHRPRTPITDVFETDPSGLDASDGTTDQSDGEAPTTPAAETAETAEVATGAQGSGETPSAGSSFVYRTKGGVRWDDPRTVLVLFSVAVVGGGVLLSLLSAPDTLATFALSPDGLGALAAVVVVGVVVYLIAPVTIDPADSVGYRLIRRAYAGVVLFGAFAVGATLVVGALPVSPPTWVAVAFSLAVGALVALAVVHSGSSGRWDEYRLQIDGNEIWLNDVERQLTDLAALSASPATEATVDRASPSATKPRDAEFGRAAADQLAEAVKWAGRRLRTLGESTTPAQDDPKSDNARRGAEAGAAALRGDAPDVPVVSDTTDTTRTPATTAGPRYADTALVLLDADAERLIATARRKLDLAGSALDADRPDLFLTQYHAAKRDVVEIEAVVDELRRRLREAVPTQPSLRTVLGGRLTTAAGVVLGVAPPSASTPDPSPSTPTRRRDWLHHTARRLVLFAENDLDEAGVTHVKTLLLTEGKIRPDLTATDVRMAVLQLHENVERNFTALRTVEGLLRLGTALGVLGFLALLGLASSGAVSGVLVPLAGTSAATTVVLVALFGFLGAVTSVLFALRDISADGFTSHEVASPLVNREFTLMRLVVGTLMGVVSYVVVTSGVVAAVLNPNLASALTGTAFVALTVAFAAGFVERFVTDAVEEFATGKTARRATDTDDECPNRR